MNNADKLPKVNAPASWSTADIKTYLSTFTYGFKTLDEVHNALGDLTEANVTERMVCACIVMRELANKIENVHLGQPGFVLSLQHKYQLKINSLMDALRATR